jgi:hypothetical protein
MPWSTTETVIHWAFALGNGAMCVSNLATGNLAWALIQGGIAGVLAYQWFAYR